MNHMLPRPRFWAETAAQIKPGRTLLGELLILMLLYLISSFVSSFLLAIPMTAWTVSTQSSYLLEAMETGLSNQTILTYLLEQMPDWMAVAALYVYAATGAAALVYCLKFQKRSPASMGLRKGGAGEYLLGLLIGLLLAGAVVAVGAAAGGYKLSADGPAADQALLCALALGGCLIRGASLELLFRGYFAPSLGVRAPVPMALISASVISALLESGGSLFSMLGLNSLLLALLLGIWVLKRGNLWGACAIHAAWIFVGSFLFGFAPAGEHAGIRLLDMDTDAFRPLLTGGDFGPEASICATVVLLAALALLLALKEKEHVPYTPSETDEQAPKFL